MPDASAAKIAHLQMIQAVIARMAGEQAKVKGYALLAIGALGSTAAATQAWALGFVAFVMTLVFWGLDANYLKQERWYRQLFDEMRHREDPADFVMTPDGTIRAKVTIYDTLHGWSVLPLYAALCLISLAIAAVVSAAPSG